MEEIQNAEPKKIFGLNWFGSDKEDDRNPERAYDIQLLKSMVQFHYVNEHYSMIDFHDKTFREIEAVNNACGDEIIVTRGVNLMPYMPEDVVYKFQVTCFNQTWT